MASKRWIAAAQAIAQLNTLTPSNVGIGNTFTVTINGKSVTFTATAGTVANVTAGLVALLSASTIPEFAEITWVDATTAITATAKVAGKPFTQTSSAAGGTAALVTVVTTASGGPNHYDVAANYSPSGVPVNGDELFIDGRDTSADILYGLDQSAVTLLSFNVAGNYTGRIGLPEINVGSTAPYVEYREQYLRVGATTIHIGYGPGSGSERIKLNTGTVQTTLRIRNSGFGPESAIPAILWKGTHAANVVEVNKGSFGAAIFGAETAVIATLRVGQAGSESSDAEVRTGAGVTLTVIEQNGGSLQIESGATTIKKVTGELTILAGNVTTLTNDAGLVDYLGTGTITTLILAGGSSIDFSRDMRDRTVTNCTMYEGSSLNDPFDTVTFTNPILLARCRLPDVFLDVGENRLIGVS